MFSYYSGSGACLATRGTLTSPVRWNTAAFSSRDVWLPPLSNSCADESRCILQHVTLGLAMDWAHSCSCFLSIHPVIAELMMHSDALSDNGRWELSTLGGGTVSSRRDLLGVRVVALSFSYQALLMHWACIWAVFWCQNHVNGPNILHDLVQFKKKCSTSLMNLRNSKF